MTRARRWGRIARRAWRLEITFTCAVAATLGYALGGVLAGWVYLLALWGCVVWCLSAEFYRGERMIWRDRMMAVYEQDRRVLHTIKARAHAPDN